MPSTNWKYEEQGRRRREEILEAVGKFIDDHGYSPTHQELATMVGVSKYTIQRHVKVLVEEGRLTEAAGPRTLRLPL